MDTSHLEFLAFMGISEYNLGTTSISSSSL